MALNIYKEFLLDLRNASDTKLARRVLSKVLDGGGMFPADKNDHRYDGIEDAWIRYISQGGAAYRVIYIRKGEDIFLYRAGPHSIEDHLNPPKPNAEHHSVSRSPSDFAMQAQVQSANDDSLATRSPQHYEDRLLKNYKPTLLRNKILSRRLVRHREIILMSPYLSEDLFNIYSPFGKVIFDLQEEGAKVTLITRSPNSIQGLKFFEKLEEYGLDVLFHEKLHAKLYLFDVDLNAYESEDRARQERLAILGSANLTKSGFRIPGSDKVEPDGNEELSYELSPHEFDFAMNFATYIIAHSNDLVTQRIQLARAKH